MTKLGAALTLISLLSLAQTAAGQDPSEHLGLLLVAHGAPKGMPGGDSWNRNVLSLGIAEKVQDALQEKGSNKFEEVKLALMESEPSIKTEVDRMVADGIDTFLVLPLFITPSDHTKSDIPTILGINQDRKDAAKKRKSLRQEGIEFIHTTRTRASFTMGPHLESADASFFKAYVLDSMRDFQDLGDVRKGVVILAHGEQTNQAPWEALLTSLGQHIQRQVPNVIAVQYGLIGHGDRFATDGESAMGKVTAHPEVEKTIVLGLFLSMSVEDMAHRANFHNPNVLFSQSPGFIKSSRLPAFLADRAIDWLKQRS